jgi:hypothetical protein
VLIGEGLHGGISAEHGELDIIVFEKQLIVIMLYNKTWILHLATRILNIVYYGCKSRPSNDATV